jgi:integrase
VIEASTHTGLRDRALLGVLAYTFARIGAVVNLKVEDYYPSGKRFLLRFKEKGGKEKELPVHHKLEELLDQYLKATGLEKELGSPLFPASIGKTGKLSRRPLVRTDAADMLKRRLKQAGLPAHYSPHSFRATGITNFLENDGTLVAESFVNDSFRLKSWYQLVHFSVLDLPPNCGRRILNTYCCSLEKPAGSFLRCLRYL